LQRMLAVMTDFPSPLLLLFLLPVTLAEELPEVSLAIGSNLVVHHHLAFTTAQMLSKAIAVSSGYRVDETNDLVEARLLEVYVLPLEEGRHDVKLATAALQLVLFLLLLSSTRAWRAWRAHWASGEPSLRRKKRPVGGGA
jgi:hypothetical protein